MIGRLLLAVGAGALVRIWVDGTRKSGSVSASPEETASGENENQVGHAPRDLTGDSHPDGSGRADAHFRPDPTAPVAAEDREGLRPVTMPAPHDPPGR